MFDSKAFCVIIFLTAAALGTAVYFQTMEMMEYKLLVKLDKQYLGGTFTGSGDTAKPATEDTTAAKDDTAKKETPASESDTAKKEDTAAAKKDDKK